MKVADAKAVFKVANRGFQLFTLIIPLYNGAVFWCMETWLALCQKGGTMRPKSRSHPTGRRFSLSWQRRACQKQSWDENPVSSVVNFRGGSPNRGQHPVNQLPLPAKPACLKPVRLASILSINRVLATSAACNTLSACRIMVPEAGIDGP
jgi:hypothetical protein